MMMGDGLNKDSTQRLGAVIDLSWSLLFEQIKSGKQPINMEASMQLYLAKIMQEIGSAHCTQPGEEFSVELETKCDTQKIDITAQLGNSRAAIELKCFKKESNRAKDLDMYRALKDIGRLDNYSGFQIKRFICLADHSYYAQYPHKGKAKSVSLQDGMKYNHNYPIVPGWQGQWKTGQTNQEEIILKADLICKWQEGNGWFFMHIDRS